MDLNRTRRETWTPRLIGASVYLFTLLSAWNLSQLTWALFQDQPNLAPAAAHAPVSADRSSSEGTAVDRIIQAQLFGQPQKAQPTRNLPETNLALVLLGTFSQPGGEGYAIIAPSKGRPAKVYRVGDELPQRAVLRRVGDHRVIIGTPGGEQVLKLVRPYGGGGLITAPAGGGPLAVAPAQIATLRQELLHNPLALNRLINASPVRKGGRILGFRIFPRSDPALFSALGLQPGDVVTSVNGIRLDSAQNMLKVSRKLREARQIAATIERNGRELTLQHALR